MLILATKKLLNNNTKKAKFIIYLITLIIYQPSSKLMKSCLSSCSPDLKFCSLSIMCALSPIACPMAIFFKPVRESHTAFLVSRIPPGAERVELVAWYTWRKRCMKLIIQLDFQSIYTPIFSL